MTKYFKNVKPLEGLENQFKALARKDHPDAGGNADTMKEIDCECDALFPVWKNRHNTERPQSQTAGTADSTRRKLYTEWGWGSSRYNSNMSTTEISKTIKIYCKEKYPTWKSSVTSEYFTGGSSINTSIMEAPERIFNLESCRKAYAEYLEAGKAGYYDGCGLAMDIEKILANDNMHWQLHSVSDRDKQCFTEYGFTIMEDVYEFMQSYNFDDSDSMVDCFHCSFYGSLSIGKWNRGSKVVPKTIGIKDQGTTPAKKANRKAAEPKKGTSKGVESNAEYAYKITKGEDTRGGSELRLIRIEEVLDREAHKAEAIAMRECGGYHSESRKAFTFQSDPTEILSGGRAA